jgi:Tfp pilus assembly protein PilF
MNHLSPELHDQVRKQLLSGNLELLDLVPIPTHSDPLVKLRTLKEALEEFDRSPDAEGAVSYLLQVRRNPASPPPAPAEDPVLDLSDSTLPPEPTLALGSQKKPSLDNIYLPNGKLNLRYLSRNAEVLLAAGEYALARNVYRAILQSGEHSAPALLGIAKCFYAEGKLDEARSHFEESIAYQPGLEAFRLLASVLIRQGKHAQAAELLERALLLKELDPAGRFELCKASGNCWARAEQPKNAERMFNRALELDPSADEIRSNLGVLELEAGRVTQASRHFQDAIASNPRNAKAHSGLGCCLLSSGDRKAAHDAFIRSLELEIQNPTAIFHLVKLAYELRTYATAARLLEDYV